jgi:hypothetical protein
MRKLFGALAIAGLAMIVSAPGADAATCWWNGFTWVCRTPPYAGPWRPYWRHPHWRQAWGPWRHHRDWRYWHERPYAWYR